MPGGASKAGHRTRRAPAAYLAVLLVVALAVLVTWLMWPSNDDDSAGRVLQRQPAEVPESFAMDSAAKPGHLEALHGEVSADEPSARNLASADTWAPETGSLLVRIRWADGRAAVGVAFGIGEMGRPDAGRFPRIYTSDEQGEARFEDIACGAVMVHLTELGALVTGVVEPGEQTLVELVAERGTAIHGLVVDELDQSVAGADIWLSSAGSGLDGRVVERTDVAGRFAFEAHLGHRSLNARKAGYQPSFLEPLEDWDGTEIVLVLRDGSGALEGRVLSPEGVGIAEADVRLGGENGWLRRSDGRKSPPPMWTRTDEQGHFVFVGMPLGSTSVAAWGLGWNVLEEAIYLPPSETVQHDLTLQPESVVSGTVTGQAGLPLEGVLVMTMDSDWLMKQRATTRADGGYVLRGLPAGELALEAHHRDYRLDKTRIQVAPGIPATWDPVLDAGSSVEGVVVELHSSAGLSGWWVLATGADGKNSVVQTESLGRFRISGLSSGPWRVAVYWPDSSGIEGAVVPEVHANSEPLRLVVDTSMAPDAGLRGRVLLPDSAPPLRNLWMELRYLDGEHRQRLRPFSESGEFEFKQLLPGRYRLTAHVPTFSSPDLGELVLVAGVVTDVGTLVLESGGTVLAFVDYRDGAVAANLNLRLRSDSHGGAGMDPLGGMTVFQSKSVAAGSWQVVARGKGIAKRAWPVEVRSGEESEVRVSVEPGVSLRVTLHWIDADLLRPGTVITVTDDRGVVVVTNGFGTMLDNTQSFETWLELGAYRVEVPRKDLPDLVRDIDLAAPGGVALDLDMEAPEG